MQEIDLHLFMKTFKSTLIFVAISAVLLSFKGDNIEKGTASYYGKSFEGRKTASGEILRNDSLTAAHKTLKFGTIVKVTNLKNDSVVVVKINDRLPKGSSRVIDLTIGAAKQLNFIKAGLTPVTLEILEKK
jgi:rare lipoprotein A